ATMARMRAGYAIVLLACGGQDPPKVAEQPKVSLPAEDPDCGVDPPYQAHAAWSGAKPTLPPPPTLPSTPTTIGDAYTVYGAMRQLHLDPAPLGKEVSIVGIVVQSNLDKPPACAFHKTGKADPENCVTEIPSFRIADASGDTFSIRVMGFASNFANVFEAAQAKE